MLSVTATDPDSGATSYSYDVSSNVVSTVGASGAVKSEFDWLNRPVKTTDGDGVLLSSFTYDPAEHKGVLASSVSRVDGRSYTSKSTAWDAWNRPLDAKWEIPSGGPVPEALAVAASNYSESYSYAANRDRSAAAIEVRLISRFLRHRPGRASNG